MTFEVLRGINVVYIDAESTIGQRRFVMNWLQAAALAMILYDGAVHFALSIKPKEWWYAHAYPFWPEFFYWPPGIGKVTDAMLDTAQRHYDIFWSSYWIVAAALLIIGCVRR